MLPEHEAEVIDLRPEVLPSDVPSGQDSGTRPDYARDRSYEAVLDAEPVTGTVVAPVHPAGGIGVIPDEPTRLPVIPEHLQTWAGVKSTARRHAGRARHHALFHGVRLPVHAARIVAYAVAGLARVAGGHLAWAVDTRSALLAAEAAVRGESREYLTLSRHGRDARRVRVPALIAEAAAVAGTCTWLAVAAPWWVIGLVLVAVVPVLVAVGKPPGRPLIKPATVQPRYRVINADVVIRAYSAAKLCDPEKPGQALIFPAPMARDTANLGSLVTVDLPYGKGFDDAMKGRPAIASGLDVTVNQTYLTPDPTSHRRHTLYVADVDPLALPAGRTPLLDLKPRSIWQPAPLGLDERGRKVAVLLLWNSLLVGSMPRVGKTFTVRLLALYAALDPFVTLLIIDGKNSPDWSPFRTVAHRYVHGTHPHREGDPVEQTISALNEVKTHIIAVNDFLTGLPIAECPEGKITPELGLRYKLLRPWLLVMEEFQTYYELDDQDANKEIAGLLSFILAVGPSAGVIVLSSSQKPSGVGAGDVQRLFNRYRDNHQLRFALRCGNRVVSEAVLGGDAYSEGFDASSLPKGERFRGVGIFYGGPDTSTVRCYLADGEDSERILAAARKHREAAGTLTGQAAGEDSGTPARDVLADVLSVFGADAGLQWPTLAERLAGALPERWEGATADSVSADVRAAGVASVDIKVSGIVRKGARRSDVEKVIHR